MPIFKGKIRVVRQGYPMISIVLAGLSTLVSPPAHAEGTNELTDVQGMRATTVIRVDILDSATETFTWQGSSTNLNNVTTFADIEVFDPSNTISLGIFSSGDTITPTQGDGAYYVYIIDTWGNTDGDQYDDPVNDWDITVIGTAPGFGRVWSYEWRMNALSFSQASAFDGSFYTVVEGGDAGHDGVVEMRTEGLAGFLYWIGANAVGIPGNDGRSAFEGGFIPKDYPVYLNPPEDANYDPLPPTVDQYLDFDGDELCDGVAFGIAGGTIEFDSNVDGTYHFICDLDGDGQYDLTSDVDYHQIGDAAIGTNQISWGGEDNLGQPVPAGNYSCILRLTVGEFHYIANDIETSYQGFRLFNVDALQNRTGLDMFWNDADVLCPLHPNDFAECAPMPNGALALDYSGPLGVAAGNYSDPTEADPASPNFNSRAWGQWNTDSKGDGTNLDTYTWIFEDDSLEFDVRVIDPNLDTDLDGLGDADEECMHGTDWNNPDTDGDGLGDYEEVVELPTDPLNPDTDGDGVDDGIEVGGDPANPIDTDNDGLINAVDDDDDDDGVLTIDEDIDNDGDPTNDNTDEFEDNGDNIPNYLDTDDDGDGVFNDVEDIDGDGDPTNDDSDGDGIPDYLDMDDDGDNVPTWLEDVDGDGDPTNDNTDANEPDGDNIPDYLDVDDDGDGIDTIDEDINEDGDPTNDHSDEDGVPDYLDPDDDGDGIDTVDEGPFDTDGDGIDDYLDLDSDNDGLDDADEGIEDTDLDGNPDFQDPDDDGDGIPTDQEAPDENPVDSDGDGTPDHLDPDDDNDGIPTLTEGGFGDDFDGDGTPNHLDIDSDGDTIPDQTEGIVDSDGDGDSDFLDLDSDNDLVPDQVEGIEDIDNDGFGNYRDPDDDGDGIPTIDEGEFTDSDGDGIFDRLDKDDDGDGIPTKNEGDWDDQDVDNDGIPNWLDLDSDGDGIPDKTEGERDRDKDEVPDYLDPDGKYTTWYRGGGLTGCSTTGGGNSGWLALVAVALLVRRRD